MRDLPFRSIRSSTPVTSFSMSLSIVPYSIAIAMTVASLASLSLALCLGYNQGKWLPFITETASHPPGEYIFRTFALPAWAAWVALWLILQHAVVHNYPGVRGWPVLLSRLATVLGLLGSLAVVCALSTCGPDLHSHTTTYAFHIVGATAFFYLTALANLLYLAAMEGAARQTGGDRVPQVRARWALLIVTWLLLAAYPAVDLVLMNRWPHEVPRIEGRFNVNPAFEWTGMFLILAFLHFNGHDLRNFTIDLVHRPTKSEEDERRVNGDYLDAEDEDFASARAAPGIYPALQ